jgi:hypothetical protein
MLITGMLISGKMSVGIVRSANGVASRIRIAITMNVYGRVSASATIDVPELPWAGAGSGFIARGARPRGDASKSNRHSSTVPPLPCMGTRWHGSPDCSATCAARRIDWPGRAVKS